MNITLFLRLLRINLFSGGELHLIDIVVAVGTKARLQLSIYNLLSNAFKYTPERETISVNIRQSADGLIAISVSDSGIGVAKEKQAELFDRFSTGRVSGDGLKSATKTVMTKINF